MELKDLSIANLHIIRVKSGRESDIINISFYDDSRRKFFCEKILCKKESKTTNRITGDFITRFLKEQMSKEGKILVDIKFVENISYDAVVVFYER